MVASISPRRAVCALAIRVPARSVGDVQEVEYGGSRFVKASEVAAMLVKPELMRLAPCASDQTSACPLCRKVAHCQRLLNALSTLSRPDPSNRRPKGILHS